MRCVIGKFQSVSGTPLKWQPYLSTSRACLQRSPPFAFRVTGKRWQGCVRECLHVRVQVYDSYLSCKPSHKKLDSNTQTAAFKAERGNAALFLWFFRFLQCTDCVLPGKLGEITSHLGAESPREQLKVSVYTHTHTRAHSPQFSWVKWFSSRYPLLSLLYQWGAAGSCKESISIPLLYARAVFPPVCVPAPESH